MDTTFNSTTNSTNVQSETYEDDTLQIVLPFCAGLFVAITLCWMLIRYKTTEQNLLPHSGPMTCCPDKFFDSLIKLRKFRIHPNSESGMNTSNNRILSHISLERQNTSNFIIQVNDLNGHLGENAIVKAYDERPNIVNNGLFAVSHDSLHMFHTSNNGIL